MKIFVCPLKYHNEHYFGTWQKKKTLAASYKVPIDLFTLLSVHPILIMEIIPCGDLLGFLRKSRGLVDKYYRGGNMAQKLETYDLVLFAKQIAAGMVFLGSRGVSEWFAKYLSQ